MEVVLFLAVQELSGSEVLWPLYCKLSPTWEALKGLVSMYTGLSGLEPFKARIFIIVEAFISRLRSYQNEESCEALLRACA